MKIAEDESVGDKNDQISYEKFKKRAFLYYLRLRCERFTYFSQKSIKKMSERAIQDIIENKCEKKVE